MPTDFIHRIGIAAPAETIYRAIRLNALHLKVAAKMHGKKK
jgi:hypothetical protein